MAFFDTSFAASRTTIRQRLSQRLAQRLTRLFETPFDRRYSQRTARVEALRALTDAELAARGIAREDILFHVFSCKA